MRFNNIQILRVAAATAVVFYHLGCHAPTLIGVDPAVFRSGWIAVFPVPLFFAVSGFVLAHAARSAPPGRFLLARFLRLYPGYWLALAAMIVLMRLRVYTEYRRWEIYFVRGSTVTLWPVGTGHVMYVLGVEWSLVYEVFLSVALCAMSLFGTRRGVPVLSGVWLAVIGAKVVLWPGFAFDPFPHWSTIALSAYNVPFLLGVLAYQLRDRGRRWRWVVLPVVLGAYAALPPRPITLEGHWCGAGLVGAGAVWLAVQFRQLPDRNRLVRLGDCTYGLFLFHVPLMLAVLYPAARLGWGGRAEVVWVAGIVAVAGGLLFGRLEAAMHARLRPLAKMRAADPTAWAGRLMARVGTRHVPR